MAACVLLLAAAAPGARAAEKVTIQLKWQHQFQFAGYSAAQDQGYYRDAGLDVTLAEAVPGGDPLQNVASGGAQYGVGNTTLLLATPERQILKLRLPAGASVPAVGEAVDLSWSAADARAFEGAP